MENRFGWKSFDQATPEFRVQLASQLAQILRERLRRSGEFHIECYHAIDELRKGGHSLWSFDEADDFQTWAPDYAKGETRGLHITFSAEGEVAVRWADKCGTAISAE